MTTPFDHHSRREFLRSWAAALALGFSSRPAGAAAPSSPEATARCALNLFREDSSEDFLSQFDAKSLETFAARLIELLAALNPQQRVRAAQTFGHESFDSLRGAAPRDLLQSLLTAWREANPEAVAALREYSIHTVGCVVCKDQAYVPYRLVNDLGEWVDLRIHPRVLTLKRQGEVWEPLLLTDGIDLGAAFLANGYRLPPLRVEILGRLRDGEHEYFVNRQTFTFPAEVVRVVAANYANATPAILAAAHANDFAAAERLIRDAVEEFHTGYLGLLKTRDELARNISAGQATDT